MLISDVFDNSIRFKACSDTLWMLHSHGMDRHGDYFESISLVHGVSPMIPGNKNYFLLVGFGTRLAFRLSKIAQKLANHGQFGLVAMLPTDVVI